MSKYPFPAANAIKMSTIEIACTWCESFATVGVVVFALIRLNMHSEHLALDEQ